MRGTALAAVLLLAVPSAPAGDVRPARHPRYDDRGTLSWSTRLSSAQRAAKASGKIIFLEFGGGS